MWRRVARECPWLRRADRSLVELLCRSWFQMTVADRRLVKLVVDGGGAQIADLERLVNHARAACLRMLAELGATATARARVIEPGGASRQGDPLSEKYFG